MASGSIVSLATPAEPASVQLLRLVVAAEAARADLPYEAVEEARILVSEAATALLEAAPGASTMTLRLSPGAGHLWIRLETDRTADRTAIARGWPWQIISGLAIDASIETSDRAAAVEFRTASPTGSG